jgi:anti-sigma B factor antagonist
MSDLGITTRETDGVSVMDLSGDIALGDSSAKLRDALKALVADGKRRIVLNMADVRRLDSSGLGTMVAGYTSVERDGGTLKLANLSDRVIELMAITKLHTVFDVFESTEEAVKSFGDEGEQVTAELDRGMVADMSNSSLH